jgi:mono/diheme cytochrome c family protein
MRYVCFLVAICCGSVNAQSLIQRAAKVAPPRSNPFANNMEAAQAGAKLFSHACSYCHGQSGVGNGRKRTPPLTTPLVKNADAGVLFYVLENGSEGGAMPSFAYMPDLEKWQIITFLQRCTALKRSSTEGRGTSFRPACSE